MQVFSLGSGHVVPSLYAGQVVAMHLSQYLRCTPFCVLSNRDALSDLSKDVCNVILRNCKSVKCG